jgi:ABC-type multidrug transport system ATPase subunit
MDNLVVRLSSIDFDRGSKSDDSQTNSQVGTSGKTPILIVQKVTKKYGKFIALDSVSLELPFGSHTVLLGQNGAGKSTLMKSIMGLIKFEGHITIDGFDVKKDYKRAKQKMGYVPQNYSFYDNLTVYEHMRFTTKLKQTDQNQIQEKLTAIDLWDARKKKVKSLSSGMRQRLGIAQALLGDPPLLLLDEPTSNVDYKGQEEFRDILRRLLKEQKTIVTTTHLPGLTELATEIKIVDRGRIIAEGPPLELMKKMGLLHTIRVKTDDSSADKILDSLKVPGVVGIERIGPWLVIRVTDESKMNVLKILNLEFNLEDAIIEPLAIESEYLRIVGDKRT